MFYSQLLVSNMDESSLSMKDPKLQKLTSTHIRQHKTSFLTHECSTLCMSAMK